MEQKWTSGMWSEWFFSCWIVFPGGIFMCLLARCVIHDWEPPNDQHESVIWSVVTLSIGHPLMHRLGGIPTHRRYNITWAMSIRPFEFASKLSSLLYLKIVTPIKTKYVNVYIPSNINSQLNEPIMHERDIPSRRYVLISNIKGSYRNV